MLELINEQELSRDAVATCNDADSPDGFDNDGGMGRA